MTSTSHPVAPVAAAWALAYGLLRTYWQLTDPPRRFSPVDSDLVVFPGWWGVGLCALAVAVAAMMWRPARRGSPVLLVLAGLMAVAFVAAAALLVLDLVGVVFPGLGIGRYPAGAASRVACVGTGMLLALAARSYRDQHGIDLPCAGWLRSATAPLDRTPRWAFWAAYASVTACLVRIAAQLVVGLDESPLAGGAAAIAFESCFVLAGTLLPLALVHSWGVVWPRWVLGLAGRRVPRGLVLGPGTGVSVMIVVYFGVGLVQMVIERLQGRNPFPPDARMDLPESFFWVAVPAYFVWGAALGVASRAYHRRTRSTEGPGSLAGGMAGAARVPRLES